MLITINLLPITEKTEHQQKKLNSQVLTICIIISLVFAGLSILLYSYSTALNLEVKNIDQKLTSEQTKAKAYTGTENELKNIASNLTYAKTLESQGINWDEFIQKFSNIVPEKVRINSLNATSLPNPSLDISGTADSRREAIKFLEKIKTVDFLKDPTLKSLDKSDSGTVPTFSFSINTKIVPPSQIPEKK